jgi:uncharacterized protein YecT (DUF1311 family)
MTFFFYAILYLFQSCAIGASPSFDCKKALTSVEHTICESDSLSKLDRSMEQLHQVFTRIFKGDHLASFQKNHRVWIAHRNSLKDKPTHPLDIQLEETYLKYLLDLCREHQFSLKNWAFDHLDEWQKNPNSVEISVLQYFLLSLTPKSFLGEIDIAHAHGELLFIDLDDYQTIVLIPVLSGAYQNSYSPFLLDKKEKKATLLSVEDCSPENKITSSFFLTEPTYSTESKKLSTFSKHRGLGDCATQNTYLLTKDKVKLLESLAKDNCDGKPYTPKDAKRRCAAELENKKD